MPPPQSFGVFVSNKVVADHDRDQLKRLCFKTTSNYEFGEKALDDEDRNATKPESMELVYTMGSKPSRYMGIMARDAPNWAREHSMYSSEFPRHSLGDSVVNKMLAERNNPNFRGKPPNVAAEVGTTTYGADFASRSAEARRKAKLESQRPPGGPSVVTSGDMLEVRSFAHDKHSAFDLSASRRFNGGLVPPVDNLAVDSTPLPDFLMRSTYGSSFNQLRASASEGRLRTRYPSMTRRS
mmetsp:Transcript_86845/g.218633  ORF Transcript_86845/g.218633 Transcript_86845/m.218633 type:complete len:239 (+) Transcript_86845:63-779(+)